MVDARLQRIGDAASTSEQQRQARARPSQCKLHRQLSETPCVLNLTFGCDRKHIWTALGCRGQFNCMGRLVKCSDHHCESNRCSCEADAKRSGTCDASAASAPEPVPSRNLSGFGRCEANATGCGVELVKQLSSSPCVKGVDFGCCNADEMWRKRCRGWFSCGDFATMQGVATSAKLIGTSLGLGQISTCRRRPLRRRSQAAATGIAAVMVTTWQKDKRDCIARRMRGLLQNHEKCAGRTRGEGVARSSHECPTPIIMYESTPANRYYIDSTERPASLAGATFVAQQATTLVGMQGATSRNAKRAFVEWLASSDYAHAWHLEDDVVYRGEWTELFARYAHTDADLVAEVTTERMNRFLFDRCELCKRWPGLRPQQVKWPALRMSRRFAAFVVDLAQRFAGHHEFFTTAACVLYNCTLHPLERTHFILPDSLDKRRSCCQVPMSPQTEGALFHPVKCGARGTVVPPEWSSDRSQLPATRSSLSWAADMDSEPLPPCGVQLHSLRGLREGSKACLPNVTFGCTGDVPSAGMWLSGACKGVFGFADRAALLPCGFPGQRVSMSVRHHCPAPEPKAVRAGQLRDCDCQTAGLRGFCHAPRRADALACHGGDHGNDRTALGPACCQARQQAASAEGRAGTAETCEAGWTPCAWRPQDRLAWL